MTVHKTSVSETTGLAVPQDSTDIMKLVLLFFRYRYTELLYSLWIFTHNPYYFLSLWMSIHILYYSVSLSPTSRWEVDEELKPRLLWPTKQQPDFINNSRH